MLGSRWIKVALVAGLALADALVMRKPNLNELIRPYKRGVPLQDIVGRIRKDV